MDSADALEGAGFIVGVRVSSRKAPGFRVLAFLRMKMISRRSDIQALESIVNAMCREPGVRFDSARLLALTGNHRRTRATQKLVVSPITTATGLTRDHQVEARDEGQELSARAGLVTSVSGQIPSPFTSQTRG